MNTQHIETLGDIVFKAHIELNEWVKIDGSKATLVNSISYSALVSSDPEDEVCEHLHQAIKSGRGIYGMYRAEKVTDNGKIKGYERIKGWAKVYSYTRPEPRDIQSRVVIEIVLDAHGD